LTLRDFIRQMPKAELHVHLEGTMQPETLLELAQTHGISLPASDVEGVRRWYTFRDFDHFVEIYVAICACLRRPEDFARVAYEYGRSMAAQNIRYAEVTFSPDTHILRPDGLDWPNLLNAVNAGRERARAEFDVEMRWIPDIVRCNPETAITVAEWLARDESRAGGVVAIGLGGPEAGWPPELFVEAFAYARERGLHSNPHAGEMAGPESVWGALRALGAERLGHGVRSVEDPALVEHLVAHGTPLEVCPTSNICLNAYPSYAAHPLKTLVEAGACVTINSDDPALFNTTLVDEYMHAVEDCGLTVQQLEAVALNAVRAAYLPAEEKSALRREFEGAYAGLRDGLQV